MTNAGKTHTIQGSPKSIGLFPRLVTSLLSKCADLVEANLQLSILEIYQEKLNDLLSNGNKKEKLAIRDGNGRIEISNLTTHAVTSVAEAVKCLDVAASKR